MADTTRDDLRNDHPWAELSHKAPFAYDQAAHFEQAAYLPTEDTNRLNAYRVLRSYHRNVSRNLLTRLTSEERAVQREYGDANLLVERCVAGVLGDEPSIFLPGKAKAEQPPPDLRNRPPEPTDDLDDLETQLAAAVRQGWDAQFKADLDEWIKAGETIGRFRAWGDYLKRWAADEHYWSKKTELESEYVVPLGDGVEVHGWSSASGRPTYEIHDPATFFPDRGRTVGGFWERVWFVWEEMIPNPDLSDTVDPYVTRIRVVTYEMGDIVNDDNQPATRQYTYDPPGSLSARTCYKSDILFDPKDIRNRASSNRIVDDFRLWSNTWGTPKTSEDGTPIDRLDLGFDFVPVVWDTHTTATTTESGKSLFLSISQALDDMSAVYTDIQNAAAIAGIPVSWISGPPPDDDEEPLEHAAGAIWYTGEGQAGDLDSTAGLLALLDTLKVLREITAENSQIAEIVLGRVKDSQFPSGIAVKLMLTPFAQAIARWRLARHDKYALGLKMVQRIALQGGAVDLESYGLPVRAEAMFGEYLPTDTEAVVTEISGLLEAGAVSLSTAVRVLAQAGYPVADVLEEVAQIISEDTAAAMEAAEATNSDQVAADRLRVTLDEPAPPVVDPPEITVG